MKKFLDYARWDLTLRRSTYTRVIGMMALIASFPTITYLIKLVFNAFRGNTPFLPVLLPEWNITVTGTTFFMVGTLQALCIGFMFVTLKDRPERLSEFMLPAPNWMKFLWRALLVTVGAFVLGEALLIVLGLIRYIFTALFVGFSNADLMIWAPDINLSEFFFNLERANREIVFETGGLIPSIYVSIAMLIICGLAFRSVFALASAFKYRRGILYGFLVHGIVFVGLVYLAVDVTPAGDYVLEDRSRGWACYGVTFVHLLILVACWWGAWRLYRNAQLTSRRNP